MIDNNQLTYLFFKKGQTLRCKYPKTKKDGMLLLVAIIIKSKARIIIKHQIPNYTDPPPHSLIKQSSWRTKQSL